LILLDANIAIDIRDQRAETLDAVLALDRVPHLPVMVWVELEQGVHREPDMAALRRGMVDRMVELYLPVMFEPEDIRCYSRIVASLGYNRQKASDRLIAAQCLTRGASLVTRNAHDFREIEGLSLIEW
jgi:tRNA(fMet)-specific endonuclease VapC